MHLMKFFVAIYAFVERLPTSATLSLGLGMSTTKFCKGAAATENHLLLIVKPYYSEKYTPLYTLIQQVDYLAGIRSVVLTRDKDLVGSILLTIPQVLDRTTNLICIVP